MIISVWGDQWEVIIGLERALEYANGCMRNVIDGKVEFHCPMPGKRGRYKTRNCPKKSEQIHLNFGNFCRVFDRNFLLLLLNYLNI